MPDRTFTTAQVVRARRRARSGEKIAAIATDLDVDERVLRSVIRGETYKDINNIEPPVPPSRTRTGNGTRSLTAEQVVEGRRRAREGEQIAAIAADLDVGTNALRPAVRGASYKDINDVEPPVPSSITRGAYDVADSYDVTDVYDSYDAYVYAYAADIDEDDEDDEHDVGPRHGTERGYLAHIHEGSPACEPCAAAAREATEAAYQVRNAKEVRRARAKRRATERYAERTEGQRRQGEQTHRAYLPARPRPSTDTETRAS